MEDLNLYHVLIFLLSCTALVLLAVVIAMTAENRRNQRRIEDFASAGTNWFWEMDANRKFIWMSENVYDATGIPREWHYGKTRSRVGTVEADQAKWDAHLADMQAQREFKDFTYQREGPRGSSYIRTSGKPVFDRFGRFRGYRGVGADVSEEVLAKRSTQDVVTELGGAVDSLNEAMSYWDADDRLVAFNQAFFELNKAALPDPAKGAKYRDVALVHARAGVIDDAVADPEAWVDRRIQKRKRPGNNIEVFSVEGSIFEIRDKTLPDGSTISVSTDITERRRQEMELLRQRQRYQLAMREVAIWDWDTERDLIYASEKLFEILGNDASSAQELSPDALIALAHEDERAELRAKFQTHMSDTQTPLRHEGRFRTVAGEYKWLFWTGQSTPEAGRATNRYSGNIADIDERKTSELALQQRQRLETIGQLTGGVAHDFNNLLAIILGNAEMLGDEEAIDQTLVQSIQRAAERGSALTSRLLAYARQSKLEVELSNLLDVARASEELMRQSFGISHSLAVRGPTDLWSCLVDQSAVEDALLNLVINARDAMEQGGEVLVTLENVSLENPDVEGVSQPLSGDFVKLSVHDTGHGIAEDIRARVFEPFFTTKEVGKGSGLGLAMVQGFARQSGGFVDIDSQPDRGTTVSIYFPRA